MGRRALTAERRAQILDACEAVVAGEGLAAATPSRLAREVGLDRTTVHHYFRTQRDLLAGLVERLTEGYLDAALGSDRRFTPPADPQRFADPLLGPASRVSRLDQLVDEIFAAAGRDSGLRDLLRGMYAELEKAMVDALARTFPDAPPVRVRETGQALFALVEGAHGLQSIGFPDARMKSAARAARCLLAVLEAETVAPARARRRRAS